MQGAGLIAIRIAYNLFTQNKDNKLTDFKKWAAMVKPCSDDHNLHHNGADKMFVFSTADSEVFSYNHVPIRLSVWKNTW